MVTLPAKRPGVPEPVPAVRTPAPETPSTQVVTQTVGQSRTPSEPATQRAVAVPNDRASLARALQRELQRVGCYDGEISGNWSTSTRMAMKAFTDRVNASLPTDAPDYILLSLVQRHEGRACGTGCPTGQLQSDEGRCVPSAVLAKASPKPAGSAAGEARAAGAGESKDGSNVSSSWAPTAGLAAWCRRCGDSGGARGARVFDDIVCAEHGRVAWAEAGDGFGRAARGQVAAFGDAGDRREVRAAYGIAGRCRCGSAANRDRSSNQRVARAEDAPKPEVNRGDEPPPRKVRKAKYKQPKIVRQFLRSMKGVMAGMPF